MMNVQSALIRVGFDVLGITTEYTLNENVLSFNPDIVVALGRGGKVTTLGVGRRLREMTRWNGMGVLILPAGYKPNPQDFGKIRADMLLEAPVPMARLVQVLAKMLGIDESQALERLNKSNVDAAAVKSSDPTIPNLKPTSTEDSILVTGGAASKPEARWVLDAEKAPKNKEQDLESLWKELTEDNEATTLKGGGATTSSAAHETLHGETVPAETVSFELKERQQSLNEYELTEVAKDLEEAKKSEHERVAKYAQFTDKAPAIDIRQSLSKVATRRVQKEIASSWNKSEIVNQDKNRQEFAKALFKKK